MTTLIEKFDATTATETAAAWPKLREILSRADKPKKDDHIKLGEAMQVLGITRSDLPRLVEVLAEFAGLVNVDERLMQALVTAENAKSELAKAEADGEVKVKAFVEWRDTFQIHLFRIRAFVEAADKDIATAQQQRERRIGIARQHPELVGIAEAQAVISDEQDRQDEQDRIQRDELAAEARKSALSGHFSHIMQHLPADEFDAMIEKLARGILTRGDINPNDEYHDRLIEVNHIEDPAETKLLALRGSLAARLGSGAITRTEAGKAVVSMAIQRGLIRAKATDDSPVAPREQAVVTGGWQR